MSNLAKKWNVWRRSGTSTGKHLGELQNFCVQGHQEKVCVMRVTNGKDWGSEAEIQERTGEDDGNG